MSRKEVLIVDDDQDLCEQLVEALQDLTEAQLNRWLTHSRTLRLSVVERLANDGDRLPELRLADQLAELVVLLAEVESFAGLVAADEAVGGVVEGVHGVDGVGLLDGLEVLVDGAEVVRE